MFLNKSIEEILKEYGQNNKDITAIYLYGSYAKGKATVDSDIDVAILAKPYKDKLESFEARLNYQKNISKLLKKEIDVVFIQEAGELLSYQIIKYGKVIFERDKGERCEFQARRVIQCLDFQLLLDRMQKGMIDAIRREAYGR